MPKLTDSDRDIIRRARELAAADSVFDLRPIAGRGADVADEFVRAEALGVAQYLLGQLADIAERLAGS